MKNKTKKNKLIIVCMSLFLLLLPLFGSNVSSVFADSPQKAVFIGDDTLEGLSAITKDSQRFSYLYEKRKGLTWVKGHEKELLKAAKQGDAIIFSVGLSEVSSLSKVASYTEYFNKFAKDHGKKYRLYVKSIDPVDETKYGVKINNKIVQWNEKIKVSLNDKISYIDSYGMLIPSFTTLSNGYYYDGATSQRLFDFILKSIGMPSDAELRAQEANSKDYTESGQNTWGRDKAGERVYYDENGNIVKSTLKDIDGATYFFDKDGHYVKGLHEFEGYTSFFNEVGIMAKGGTAKVDKEHLMLFDNNGHQMKDKWQELNGKKYYIDNDGYALTGWWTLGTTDYYFTEDGSVAKGIVAIKNDLYWFNEDGSARVGWYEENGNKYYFGDGGKMVRGLKEINGKYYHFKDDGSMSTGWVKTDDGKFYFDTETGEAAVGKKEIDGKIYFFTKKGQLKLGWVDVDGDKYYYKEDGTVYTGKTKIGNHFYFFDSEGKALSGWQGKGKERRFYKKDTFEMATGWLSADGKRYYFKEDGSIYNGLKKVDGAYHLFNSEGASIFSLPALLVNLVIFIIVVAGLSFGYIKNKVKVDSFAKGLYLKLTEKNNS